MTWEEWTLLYLFVGAFLTLDHVIESPATYLSFVGLATWKRGFAFLFLAAITPALTAYVIVRSVIEALILLVRFPR